MTLYRNKKYLLTLSLFFLLSLFGRVDAATIHFSPAAGDLDVGNILNVSILVNTQGQAINNADAVINFPKDLLEVVSLSKSGSIFSLWVEEPSYSNGAGTVSFNGGVPNPGFNGGTGKMLGVVFRVKKIGNASLLFSAAAVRANDGLGTNVLSGMGTASYTISAAPPPPVPVVVPVTPRVEPVVEKPVEKPVVEETSVIDLGEYQPEPKPVEEAPSKRFPFEIPTFEVIVGYLIKFLSLVIPIVALFFLLHKATGKKDKETIVLKRKMRKSLHALEHLVDRSFNILGDDIGHSAHMKQDLIDAEKVIQEKILSIEKDIED